MFRTILTALTLIAATATQASAVEVKQATMQLKKYATLGGACMVELTTSITTDTAGATISFKYIHNSGKKSKTFTAKTKGNGIALVKHQWDIPNGPGLEVGGFRMEGVSPKFISNTKAYSLDCKPKAPGGFSATPKRGTSRILSN